MELLGRDVQLACAGRAIGDVRRGSGRVLGLLGGAGLGKSALLAEIGERARAAGLQVVAGRGSEHERDVPYGLIVDALGEDAGAPGEVPVAERFLRHRAVASRLVGLGPVAVLLDDLHWADEASLELVLHLLRRPVAVPALLVIAARPVGPAGRLLDAARSAPGWEQLALDPLDRQASLELVAGVTDPAVRERVVREARGIPLYLHELARVADRGDGALPPTLLAAIGFEVAALAAEPRALIEGAAVVGEPFDPELAAITAGLEPSAAPAALDALVAADLVRPAANAHGQRFDNGHAFAAAARTGEASRAGDGATPYGHTHAAAPTGAPRAGGSSTPYGHTHAAAPTGEPSRACDDLARTATPTPRQRPPGRGGPVTTRRRAASRWTPRSSRPRPWAARSSFATRSSGVRSMTPAPPAGGWGRTSGPRPRSSGAAPSPAARAFHVVRSAHAGDPEAVAILSAAAEAAGEASPAAAAHWFGAALRLVPDRDHDARSGLLAQRALALAGAGRLTESRTALLEALALAPRLELTVACARVETQLGLHADARRRLLAARADAPPDQHAALAFELAAGAFHEGRVAELRGWAEPAVQAAQDDPLLLVGAEALLGLGALWRGDPATAAAALDRASAGLDALDDATLASHPAVPMYVGVAQFLNERFCAATATSARALEIARRTGQGQLVVTLLGLRAMSLAFRLELDAALAEADAAEEAARLQGVPPLLHFAFWVRALVHDIRGETTEAERLARDGAALTAQLEPSKLTRTAACEFAALEEDPVRVLRLMGVAAGPLLEDADPTHRTWLLLRLVRAAIAAGELDLAEEWAEASLAHAERLQLAAGSVRAAVACAEVVLARGDAAEAAIVAEHACLTADAERAPLDALDARLLMGRALAAAGDARARDILQRVAADAGRAGARACTTPPGASCGGSARACPPRRAAPRGATRR